MKNYNPKEVDQVLEFEIDDILLQMDVNSNREIIRASSYLTIGEGEEVILGGSQTYKVLCEWLDNQQKFVFADNIMIETKQGLRTEDEVKRPLNGLCHAHYHLAGDID